MDAYARRTTNAERLTRSVARTITVCYNQHVLGGKDKVKKVLHIVRLAEGGMQKHVLSLISRLDPERFSSALTAAPGFLQSDEINAEFLPVEIGDNLSASSLDVAWRISQFARRRDVDIIHAHGYKAAAVGAATALLARKPFVFTAHNLFPLDAGGQARMALRFCAMEARRIIAVSNGAVDRLVRAGVKRDLISVIPNGIDLAEYKTPVDRDEVRKRLGLADGQKAVVCVARLTRVKGVQNLVEAAPAITEAVPETRIIIVGSGPDEHALRMLVQAAVGEDKVRMLGYRDDAREILAIADVVAVPSIEEGQSIVTLEAMALGRPVVATDAGGLTDMISDGTTGVLVPAGSAQELAEGVIKVLREPQWAEGLCKSARNRVEEEFTIEKMVRQTQELYSCVLG